MLIGLALLACVATLPLAGGSWERLSRVRFSARWAILAAIALQVLIVSALPGGAPLAHRAAHLASYALAAWFVWANRRIAGVPLMALGGALNLVAIAANGGVMPASAGALAHAGMAADTSGFANSDAVAHPHLAWLGDVFATPAGLPFSNVFSVGDVILVIGALVGLHVAASSRPARRLQPVTAVARAAAAEVVVPRTVVLERSGRGGKARASDEFRRRAPS